MILSNKMYDGLKWVTLILLPALAVFYVSLAEVWGLPKPVEVSATIAAIDLFLGALLGLSVSAFKAAHPLHSINLIKMAGDMKGQMVLSARAYEILTWVAQIFLPAAAAFYGAIGAIWGLPNVDKVVPTIVALDTLLGLLLGFSTAQFHKKVAQTCVEENIRSEWGE